MTRLNRAMKVHTCLMHKLFCRPLTPVCPGKKNLVCRWDELGFHYVKQGETWGHPKGNRTKKFMFMFVFLA